MLNIILKTLVVYSMLLIAMRIGGKRQIGELQISELVTAFLLSEIASLPISNKEISVRDAALSVATVIALELLIAFAVTKSKALRKLFNGKPSALIEKGKLNIAEMKSLRLSTEELISEARLCGIADLSELEYAILEDNGKLSVFKKAQTPQKEKGIAHIIISDGEVNKAGMKASGMTDERLQKILKKKNLTADAVFLYTVNDLGEEYVVLKSEERKEKSE